MPITDYEPKHVWGHFDEIRKIPRCSGHEELAREYILEYAKKNNFEAQDDEAGNVVVRVPATPGHENAPTVVLQGHLDMVCERNSDVAFEFAKDPIELVIDGEWLKANGTTLGSDNGIGLAASLAAVDDKSVVHGPLEILCTVDEEVGLTGAGKLQPGFLNGKYMLNLDSEELGSVFIGCAGGGDSTINLPVSRSGGPSGAKAVRVQVAGLRGGHSGLDISDQRGNAIKTLARVLWEAGKKHDIAVVTMQGGNKRNAIPREAQADVLVADVDGFGKLVSQLETTITVELGGKEKLSIKAEQSGDAFAQALDKDSQARLLNLLMALPHGVEAMNYDIPDLVETSNNVATIETSAKEVVIGTSTRSSIGSALQALRDRIRGAAELAGAAVTEDDPYPGWQPDLDSNLLKVTKKVHNEVFGTEPEAKAIHAGLECGIIGEKFPGMDMISFGPIIQNPHSPDERINIPSVEKFWSLLKAILEELT
jgi:dipeptidase D